MKRYSYLVALVIVFLLPCAVVSILQRKLPEKDAQSEESIYTATYSVSVDVIQDESINEMELETYVASVLRGEMPASFDMEALKAQAVAVRTYTLRSLLTGGKHPAGHLCTDPGCCQAFSALEEDDGSERIIDAVTQTAGEVLLYGGELIEATYFSCSGGRTEAAVAVWGADVPYLQAKDSPGEESAAHFQDTLILSREEFCENLGLSGNPDIGQISYTEGGGIASAQIGGVTYSGTQLRNLLSLRSTVITFTEVPSGVLITTKGFGHRVGMSQYGADAMARKGSTYRQILTYYYPGTDIRNLSPEEMMQIFDKA